jgi:hypothetical protein
MQQHSPLDIDHAQDMAMRIAARRNKLLGAWAAELMALTHEEREAYARALIQTAFEGLHEEDMVRKLLGDIIAADVEVSEAQIRAAMARCEIAARQQLLELK